MAEKLVSASMCKQWVVIQFLNGEEKNGNKIHERLCNMYTKAISQSNVYEWIKKFNEGCVELCDEAQLGQPSDLVNEETCRIVHCSLNNDRCVPIFDLLHEIARQHTYVNVSWASIYQE